MKIWNVAGKTIGFIIASLLAMPIGVALLLWAADGPERGRFDDAKIISVRYIVSVIVFCVLLLPFFAVAKSRQHSTEKITWGEAMVAATYVFFLLFWLYGIIPHEYLNWADAELQMRPDMKIIGPEGTWDWWGTGDLIWTRIPLTVTKQSIRDIVAVLIYGIGLGGFIWACWFWNNRGKASAEVEQTSAYGRPLVAKAKG